MKYIGIAALLLAGTASAQSMSAEDIERMLDEEAAAPDPYLALLNDPDPARSRGAMRIMLESGDPALVELALEAGLQSSDDRVNTEAIGLYLMTAPYFEIVLEGSPEVGSAYETTMRDAFAATIDAEGRTYLSMKVGAFDADRGCYIDVPERVSYDGKLTEANCQFRIVREGILFSSGPMSAMLVVDDKGDLSGVANISGAGDPVPIEVRLLD